MGRCADARWGEEVVRVLAGGVERRDGGLGPVLERDLLWEEELARVLRLDLDRLQELDVV